MKTKLIRMLSLLLALITLLALTCTMIGCIDDPDDVPGQKDPENPDEKDPSEKDPDEKDPDEEDPGNDDPYASYNIPDSLPERNFAQEGIDEFVIACQDDMVSFFWVEDYDGGIVDNAVYRSVAAVEERFGTTVTAYQAASHNAIKNSITTQDGSFDFAFMLDVTASGFSLENLFVNLYNLESLDFSKPWWPAPSVEALTYQNKMYLGSSTMSYLGLGQTFLTYFNKTIFTDNGLDYPYEAVMEGDWYLEDLIGLAEGYGTYDDNNDFKDTDDTFGFLCPNGFYGCYESFGIEMIKKEGDDLILNAHCTEAYDLIEDLHYILIESDFGYTDTEQLVNTHDRQRHLAPVFWKGRQRTRRCQRQQEQWAPCRRSRRSRSPSCPKATKQKPYRKSGWLRSPYPRSPQDRLAYDRPQPWPLRQARKKA